MNSVARADNELNILESNSDPVNLREINRYIAEIQYAAKPRPSETYGRMIVIAGVGFLSIERSFDASGSDVGVCLHVVRFSRLESKFFPLAMLTSVRNSDKNQIAVVDRLNDESVIACYVALVNVTERRILSEVRHDIEVHLAIARSQHGEGHPGMRVVGVIRRDTPFTAGRCYRYGILRNYTSDLFFLPSKCSSSSFRVTMIITREMKVVVAAYRIRTLPWSGRTTIERREELIFLSW